MLLYWMYRFCRSELFTCKNFIDYRTLLYVDSTGLYIIIYTLELKLVVNSYQNNVVEHWNVLNFNNIPELQFSGICAEDFISGVCVWGGGS